MSLYPRRQLVKPWNCLRQWLLPQPCEHLSKLFTRRYQKYTGWTLIRFYLPKLTLHLIRLRASFSQPIQYMPSGQIMKNVGKIIAQQTTQFLHKMQNKLTMYMGVSTDKITNILTPTTLVGGSIQIYLEVITILIGHRVLNFSKQ